MVPPSGLVRAAPPQLFFRPAGGHYWTSIGVAVGCRSTTGVWRILEKSRFYRERWQDMGDFRGIILSLEQAREEVAAIRILWAWK